MLKPVYTEPENCQDCYKCVRECPVKAIMVAGNKASIIESRCIYCGHCTQVCPTGAKKVRDGLTRAKLTLQRNPGRVYLSLAPSWVSEFGDGMGLVRAVKRLGFAGVSETALGAELVTEATRRLVRDKMAIAASSGATACGAASSKTGGSEKLFVSSSCPVVVEWVRKYAPDYTKNITPIVSPMLAHARMLREEFGDDIKVIFAGPCVGKKSESDRFPELVDVAITFKDLHEWLALSAVAAEENSALNGLASLAGSTPAPNAQALNDATIAAPDDDFVPRKANMGALYPIEGGMIEGMKAQGVRCMSFSGLDVIRDVFEGLEVDKLEQSMFLELLACRGGCINGPARLKNVSMARKRNDVECAVAAGRRGAAGNLASASAGAVEQRVAAKLCHPERAQRAEEPLREFVASTFAEIPQLAAFARDDNPNDGTPRDVNPQGDSTNGVELDMHLDITPDPQFRCKYSEQEVVEALAALGKTLPSDELNCSSCGYDSCRDFAEAMLDGHAESNMCASYMRRIAHDKATVLLQKIPAGVVLVGADLKVLDMNRTFAEYLGDETELLYDTVPGMAGAEIDKLSKLGTHFKTVLATGEELRERRVSIEGKTWLLSIYNIQQHRQVFGLLQDIDEPTVRQEWMLEKMREVIRNHMTTVQNVAGLLGENAAFTDATMRSIIEVMDGGTEAPKTSIRK